jgi:hypothetical protein
MAHQVELQVRQGWTERIRMALTINGGTVINLTGMTLALVGKDRDSTDISFAGSVGTDDAAGGIIYLDPGAADLLASRSPYRLRWSVTANSKTAFFPHDEPMFWIVELP